MCEYEEFAFTCDPNHSVIKLKCYCHFARNSAAHHCFGVKILRIIWEQGRPCDSCMPPTRALTHSEQMQEAYRTEERLAAAQHIRSQLDAQQAQRIAAQQQQPGGDRQYGFSQGQEQYYAS
jgi:hypothetical protein